VGGTPRITFSHAKEHAFDQPSFSLPPPPQQGCRRCALLSSILVFVIIFIVIVIIVIIAIIASRSLLSASTQHITRACVEGHHNYYTSFSPPSRPVQGSRRYIFYLISVLMDSGF
jgi:CBS domain containing-hemolysin-like protein